MTEGERNYIQQAARLLEIAKREMENNYRLVVGEIGNEQGHIIYTKAKSYLGAKIALGRALATYGGDGWGRVECQASNGEWGSYEEAVGEGGMTTIAQYSGATQLTQPEARGILETLWPFESGRSYSKK